MFNSLYFYKGAVDIIPSPEGEALAPTTRAKALPRPLGRYVCVQSTVLGGSQAILPFTTIFQPSGRCGEVPPKEQPPVQPSIPNVLPPVLPASFSQQAKYTCIQSTTLGGSNAVLPQATSSQQTNQCGQPTSPRKETPPIKREVPLPPIQASPVSHQAKYKCVRSPVLGGSAAVLPKITSNTNSKGC